MPKIVEINARKEDFDDEEDAKVYTGKYVFKRLTAGQLATVIDESTEYDRRGLQSRQNHGIRKLVQFRESMIESPCKIDKTKFIERMPDWLFNRLNIMGYGQTLRRITKDEELFLEELLQKD